MSEEDQKEEQRIKQVFANQLAEFESVLSEAGYTTEPEKNELVGGLYNYQKIYALGEIKVVESISYGLHPYSPDDEEKDPKFFSKVLKDVPSELYSSYSRFVYVTHTLYENHVRKLISVFDASGYELVQNDGIGFLSFLRVSPVVWLIQNPLASDFPLMSWLYALGNADIRYLMDKGGL